MTNPQPLWAVVSAGGWVIDRLNDDQTRSPLIFRTYRAALAARKRYGHIKGDRVVRYNPVLRRRT